MEQQYAVTLDGDPVGKVRVWRQGLYYHFQCRCALAGEQLCRLVVTCGSCQKSLGVLVPEGGGFGLSTKLAVKHLGEGELRFQLESSRKKQPPAKPAVKNAVFVPIYPEEPFAYIARLKQSFLVLRDGQPGILAGKTQEC